MSRKTLAYVVALLAVASHNVMADAGKTLKAGNEYLIVANYPNNLHVIDMQNDTLYKSCEMPGEFGPGLVQMSPDRKIAYVLNNHFADVYGIELDTCKPVFHARLAQKFGENARSFLSMTVSHDGREIYTVANPTKVFTDHYEVQQPRLQVYAASGGMNAKPIRTFPAPRQMTLMQGGVDGSLYVLGPDLYKVDTKTGKFNVILPLRNSKRPNYSPPDVLYAWGHQTYRRDFSFLQTAMKFKDGNQDPAAGEIVYGYSSVDLTNGKTETADFLSPVTEVYFSGMRSPKDPNLMFTVLNHLSKFDIKQQKLIKSAALDHSYYCVTLNKAGSKVYLTGTFNDVAIYDADSMERIGGLKLPGGDMALNTAQAFIR